MRTSLTLCYFWIASLAFGARPPVDPRLLPAPDAWQATQRIPAPEAHQAAAADEKYFYAITNTLVAKYDRASEKLVAKSTGAAKHLNSGYFWGGKLYCAHSNYPALPEQSEIKVLDPETMVLETFKDFGNFGGSLTWCIRRDGHWWCNFAKYGDKNGETFLVKFDDQWREVGRWTYPVQVRQHIGKASLSGGIWDGDTLLVTGHDDPVFFCLRLPQPGSVLEYRGTKKMPFTGQGFAFDPVTRWLIGIDRSKKELVLAERDPSEPRVLRIMSYNIHHGEGVDRKLDLERIARVINSVDPDLVGLQEVDSNVPRSKSVDQVQELAKLTGMHGTFCSSIPLSGGNYGNALLSRWKVTQDTSPLPNPENGEARSIQKGVIKITDRHQPFYFLNTHFDHRPKETTRLESLKSIVEFVKEQGDAPMIMVGDFNSTPESGTHQELLKTWTRTNKEPLPTVPVEKPTEQIDYIFVKPANRFRIIKTEVLPEAVASDHRAIWAEIELLPSQNVGE